MSDTKNTDGARILQQSATSASPCAAARTGASTLIISQPAAPIKPHSQNAGRSANVHCPDDMARAMPVGSPLADSVSSMQYSGYTI